MYSQLSVANAMASNATAIMLVIVAKLNVTAEQGILRTVFSKQSVPQTAPGKTADDHPKKQKNDQRKQSRINHGSFSCVEPSKFAKNQVVRTSKRVDKELLRLKVVLR